MFFELAIFTAPSTDNDYVLCGYVTGTLANFYPKLAPKVNPFLFPAGGFVLAIGYYEQAREAVIRRHGIIN